MDSYDLFFHDFFNPGIILALNYFVAFSSSNIFFLTIFMCRNYHFKNLRSAKYLFELIYTTKLEIIYSQLENITFYEKKYESNEKILESLKEWHKVYFGIYPIEDSENEQLLYKDRQSFVEEQELEKFRDLFNSLKINIAVETNSFKTEENYDKKQKVMDNLSSFLENFIKLIDIKIQEREKEKQRKKELRDKIRDYNTIIIAILSLVLSIFSFYVTIFSIG